VRKCSAFSTLREQSRGEEFAEEQPSTSVRLGSARLPTLGVPRLAWVYRAKQAVFRYGQPMSPVIATSLWDPESLRAEWEFVVSILGLPSRDGVSNR